MKRSILFAALLFMSIAFVSAQKQKVYLMYRATEHNKWYTQDHKEKYPQLISEPEPYILYSDFNGISFPPAYLNRGKNTFQVVTTINLPEGVEDMSRVDLRFKVENATRKEYHWLCYSDSKVVLSIPLKDACGKGEAKVPICCMPPVAPRGKELFLYVKAKIDMRNEDNCSVEYEIKEERMEKPLMLPEWPTEEDFEKRVWYRYMDEEEGFVRNIYIDGLMTEKPLPKQ